MILYKIREWASRYENAQSRRCEQLHWVPIPARHDAERYGEIMSRPDASEIYSAWIICLQVGARSEPRGSLVRSDGSPHTPDSLAIKTRGHKKWFEKALPYLSQIGWLECVTTEKEASPTSLGVSSESGMQEGKGMEEKEMKEDIMSGKILNYLNEKTGKKFQAVNGSLKFIIARLKEGATEDQCRSVIDLKCSKWLNDPKMGEFLRPQTLFNSEKFPGYLGEIGAEKPKTESIADSWINYKKPNETKNND